MSFSLRCLPTALLAFLTLSLSVFAQSTAPTGKLPRGTISGRVTIKDKAAAGIVVGVRKANRSSPFTNEPFTKTNTDQDGNYRITNLPAGSYEVVPSAPAFVLGGVTNIKRKNVIIGEDETIEDINFALVRGGVITGRVTDGDGRPAIQQGVQLYRIEIGTAQPQGQQQLSAAHATTTDDRGIYRAYGLTPGRYKVAAGKGEEPFQGPGAPSRFIYAQVFYPDATDQGKATILEVTEGSEVKDIDIVLGRALQTFSVSGRVVDDKNVPVPNLRFGLQRGSGEGLEFVNSMGLSNSQGDFIVEGLIPGKYGIYLFPSPNDEMRLQDVGFDIVDQDLSGITIKLSRGGSLSGSVVIETEDKSALANLSKLHLRAFVAMGTGFGGMSQSPVSPDGSFRLPGLPGGTINVFLSSSSGMSSLPGYQITRIERDGVALPRNIELKEGEDLTGLRIVVAYGTAVVRGVVKLENGTLPEGARIFVRLTKPGDNTSFGRPASADARGQFVLEGVAPGHYELSAQLFTPGTTVTKTAKRDVTVVDGVTTETVITLDLSAPVPKP